eukprot:TRINITY_DN1938_c0_g1_i3.p1 TRINITY_DN1938_c0_g1~~TRINITY_DN1938_c0_g1_i3.p1  ORF type:complete len:252 (+),score=56.65 TRINITY_DN1938_c0_g1_i3:538-1293(+)
MAPKKREREMAFDEMTMADLRALVERNDAQHLREARERISQLEKELASKDGELDKLQSSAHSAPADGVKQAIEKQFYAQMLSEKELSEKEGSLLRGTGEGREIVAIIPNVTNDVLSALALKYDGEGNIEGKVAEKFFEARPAKTLPNSGGACLLLSYRMGFKYVKSRCELKVTAHYKWSPKPKPKPPAKRAKTEEAAGAPSESAMEEEPQGEEEEAPEVPKAPREKQEPAVAQSPTPSRSPAPAAMSEDVE